MGLFDRAVATVLPAVPRSVVRRVSARTSPGRRSRTRSARSSSLNAQGKRATIDVLGEEIHSAEEAHAIAARLRRRARARSTTGGLDANVSVKLTGLGLKLDPELCRELLERLVQDARRARLVRSDRHGGLDERPTTRSRSTATARGRARRTSASCSRRACKRTLDDVDDLADLRAERALLQGDLRRARVDRVPGRREVARRASCASLDALLAAAATSGSRRTTRR